MEVIKNIKKEDLVYLDESGIEDNDCRPNGWSAIADRCYDERKFCHSLRISMIAALNNGRIIAPAIFDGYCDGDVFITYITKILVKELKAGQVLVLDNVSFHKSDKVKEAVESVGATVLFLPPYSPDLNPIEHFWFKIKNTIRKVASSFDNFADAVMHVLRNVESYAR